MFGKKKMLSSGPEEEAEALSEARNGVIVGAAFLRFRFSPPSSANINFQKRLQSLDVLGSDTISLTQYVAPNL